MARRTTTALLLLLAGVLLGTGGQAAAQQFSADMVTAGSGRSTKQRIYVADGKIRVEPPGGEGLVMISDRAAGTNYMVSPKDKSYFDLAAMQGMSQMFMPVDADDPCPQWQHMTDEMAKMTQDPSQKGQIKCERVGNETVNGRATVEYQAISPKGEKGLAWIDPKLKFVVKAQGSHGQMELQNIVEAPQPASLFVVPADYRKMDMRQMMQHMMQQHGAKPPNE